MARVRTIAAGILLGTGLFISVLTGSTIVDRNTPPQARARFATGFVLLGVCPIALGSWLVFQNQRHGTATERDRLQGIFYKLLRDHHGQINVLRFAMEAKITGDEAKAFLDDRAREFNARFDVSEEGKISYYFDGDFTMLSPAVSFDVILESVPRKQRDRIVHLIQRQMSLETRAVKSMVRQAQSTPVTIARGVSQQRANALRDMLEAEGAKTLIISREA